MGTEAPVKLSERRRAFIGCFLVYVGESATAARLGGLWFCTLYRAGTPPRRPEVTLHRAVFQRVLLAGASAAKEARL